MKKTACALLLLVAGFGHMEAGGADEALFPRPESLEPAVEFWKRVYTEVDTNSGFIHDSLHLGVVYGRVDLGNTRSSRQRRRQIDEARDRYRAILERLAAGKRESLSAEEARVLALWPDGVANAELRQAMERLRFQLGQSDRFLAGLERSGTYRAHIERVLREKELPLELAALPHVESSFDPTAYSRVGAAGMWQFTRLTGLRYMRIDHIVDERRDPFLSTHAAAQLLKDNHAVLESWPLALTAYNHGQAGMRRAAEQQGTKDIGVIIANYNGRSFGFASRNFYPAFLAALDVDSEPERYFDRVRANPPSDTALTDVPDYVGAEALARALGLSPRELRGLNPALMETVWEGDKLVPKGFSLRLPGALAARSADLFAAVPARERYAAQRPDLEHRVRSGDTLSQIAESYGVGLSTLLRANNLRSRDFIRVGQVLTLPVPGDRRAPRSLAEAAAADGEYVVRNGDTLAVIARRLGVDAAELVAANGIADENRIFPGQVLRVRALSASASGSGSAPASASAAASTVAGRPAPGAEPVAASEPASVREPVAEATPRPARAEPAPTFATVDAVDGVDAPAGPPAADDAAADAPAGPALGNFDAAAAGVLTAATLPDDDAAASQTAPEANAVATEQARLAADPSDYSIAEDGSIEVHSLETLGHYADWLGIRTQRLRDLNGFAFGRAVAIGERIELDFSNVDRAAFEQRRLAYQEGVQESFFSSYRIADVTDHVIRPGESLWLLAQRTYDVPVWLLRQYNPDLDLHRVRPGTVVKFPELTRIVGEA